MNQRAKVCAAITRRALVAVFLACFLGHALAQTADPLPSWNDGAVKKSITDFVARVTAPGGADFVPAEQRIATIDNDGTLWCEQPMYVQLAFALDRVKALSDQHPEWTDKQPFKAVLENDMDALAEAGQRGLVELVMATHAGMSTADFEKICVGWLKTARPLVASSARRQQARWRTP